MSGCTEAAPYLGYFLSSYLNFIWYREVVLVAALPLCYHRPEASGYLMVRCSASRLQARALTLNMRPLLQSEHVGESTRFHLCRRARPGNMFANV